MEGSSLARFSWVGAEAGIRSARLRWRPIGRGFSRPRRDLLLTMPLVLSETERYQFTGTIIPFSSRRRIKRSLGSRLSECYRRGIEDGKCGVEFQCPFGFSTQRSSRGHFRCRGKGGVERNTSRGNLR